MKKYKNKIIKILKFFVVCLAVASVLIINTFALTIDVGDTIFDVKYGTYWDDVLGSAEIYPTNENVSGTVNSFNFHINSDYNSNIEIQAFFETLSNVGVNGTLIVNIQTKSGYIPSWSINEGVCKLINDDDGSVMANFEYISGYVRISAVYNGVLPSKFHSFITFDSSSSSSDILFYDIS